jgi:hypothetical protein
MIIFMFLQENLTIGLLPPFPMEREREEGVSVPSLASPCSSIDVTPAG